MITCPKCNNLFEPTKKQKLLMEKIVAKGGYLVMLDCASCKREFPFVISKSDVKTETNNENPFLCPIPRCGGWVSYVDNLDGEAPFYGCGECGRTWTDKQSLDEAISEICRQYSYRKAAYEQRNGIWLAKPYQELPDDIDQRVAKEKNI